MNFKLCNHVNLDQFLSNRSEAPIPWIGLDVAVATLVCLFVFSADAFVVFHYKRFWLPFKIFSINAASLSLLSVAMKMSLDLSTSVSSSTDELIKLSIIVLMSDIMGNFMPSLGYSDDNTVFTNIAALKF